ncbi:MAG: TonB-dependent receptor domain-containing protein [Bacteroidota bacterium]
MRKALLLYLFLFGLQLTGLYGQQSVINGKIIDAITAEPLAYASVKLGGKPLLVADSSGIFRAEVQPGAYRFTITKTGYKLHERLIRVGFDERITIVFEVEPAINELEKVVVSASRQERKLAREPVSITSVQPYLIANTASNTLSDVLNRVPGISVVEGQAIIRGSVGWSYNVGSRVMVLLDDMPLMGPDVGDVQWDLLPIEAAENIEVIKGPSSVLYGSSASSGTVSVRTGWAGNKPQTRIQLYQGVTDNPSRRQAIWWERTSQPFNSGMFFSHKQKFGQLDVVWSGNVDANRSFIELNDSYRARTYLKTRYRVKSVPGLSFGVNGNLLFKKGGRFFLWQDADTNILRPFLGSSGEDYYRIWSVDPHITFTKPGNYSLALRMRHYTITRFVDTVAFPGENDALANIQALDFNVQKKWLKGLNSNSGLYLTRIWAVGNVYPGSHAGYSAAAFTQLEYEYNKWNLSAGLRYEFTTLGEIKASPGPLFRAGVNYQAAKKTFLRATYGEGFRFATIAERFVHDNVSQLSILPNPELRSEMGWYAEFGVKQGFRIGEFNASVDAAFFWQEYKDLIEFRFKQWKPDTGYIDFSVTPPVFISIPGKIGFRAINFDQTRTAGMEFTLEGDGRVGALGIRTLCGYTYTLPVDLTTNPDFNNAWFYTGQFFSSINGLDEVQRASILPYRNRHLVKTDIEFSLRKFMLGYGNFYYSVYDKIDAPLYTLIPGIGRFLQNVGNGDWVHNLRLGYAVSGQATVALLINNFTNHEYAIRPARLDPPRTFLLQVRIHI